jgi:antitoxin (DNA-binding transcriptional repressor) of toxin-antitoxin stability system
MTLQHVAGRKARDDLTKLLNAVQGDGAHVAITRYGATSAVLVPAHWHAEAQRAMAIVEGLASLAHDQDRLQQLVAAISSPMPQEVAKAS